MLVATAFNAILQGRFRGRLLKFIMRLAVRTAAVGIWVFLVFVIVQAYDARDDLPKSLFWLITTVGPVLAIGTVATWAITYIAPLQWHISGRPYLRFGPDAAPDALLDHRLHYDKTIQFAPRASMELLSLLIRINAHEPYPTNGVLRFVEKSGHWWHRRWPHADAAIVGVRSAVGPDTKELPDP